MTVTAHPTSTTAPTSTTPDATPDATASPRAERIRSRIGWVLTGLLTLFFLFDAVTKLIQLPDVVTATQQMGFPAATVPVIGGALLLCLVLFLIPRTAVIGAVALSAYLGGAVCAQLRIESDLVSATLFPVYFGLLVWAALLLRSPRLRAMVRTGS